MWGAVQEARTPASVNPAGPRRRDFVLRCTARRDELQRLALRMSCRGNFQETENVTVVLSLATGVSASLTLSRKE